MLSTAVEVSCDGEQVYCHHEEDQVRHHQQGRKCWISARERMYLIQSQWPIDMGNNISERSPHKVRVP
jgi:hypothetical protein